MKECSSLDLESIQDPEHLPAEQVHRPCRLFVLSALRSTVCCDIQSLSSTYQIDQSYGTYGGCEKKGDRRTRRVVLARETNEDQVEVSGVNNQGDWHVPEHTVSKNMGVKPRSKHRRSMCYRHPNFLLVFVQSARHLEW